MDLLLNDEWDIFVDGNGDIATTPSFGYSIAQTAANEIKLFYGEGWYDRSQGIPHFNITYIANVNWSLLKMTFLNHVNAVDGVSESNIDFYIDKERMLHGSIFLRTVTGQVFSNLLVKNLQTKE